jgi:ketosteroid isomerase-like protein
MYTRCWLKTISLSSWSPVNAERNGLSAAFPEIHVWRMRDGKATEFREYQGDEQREDRFWS